MRSKWLLILFCGVSLCAVGGCLMKDDGDSVKEPPRLRMAGGLIYVKDDTDIFHLNLQDGRETGLYKDLDERYEPHLAYNPSKNNEITFSNKVGSDYDIYVYDIGKKERVSPSNWNSGDFDRHPAYDALGEKMVFQSRRKGGANRIYFVDLKGSQKAEPVKGEDKDEQKDGARGMVPVISPDGFKIAYIKKNDANKNELYIVENINLEKPKLKPLGNSVNNPAWSPDNQTLAVDYEESDGSRCIAIVKPFDAVPKLQPVTFNWRRKADHRHPVWSGDGQVLFFTGTILDSKRTDLYAVAVDEALQKGSQAQWYVVAQGERRIEEPCWAPDIQLPQPGPTP